jgi:hypothetical protein
MVIGVTPQEAAISAMVKVLASYMRWALPVSSGVILGLRPPVRPRARAAARPAIVLSWMRAASYSAISAKMPKTSLPYAVVVSMIPLVSDFTPTPRASRVVTISTRSRRLRPGRSIFQMMSVSPGRRSARHLFHSGRLALVPVAVSV